MNILYEYILYILILTISGVILIAFNEAVETKQKMKWYNILRRVLGSSEERSSFTYIDTLVVLVKSDSLRPVKFGQCSIALK